MCLCDFLRPAIVILARRKNLAWGARWRALAVKGKRGTPLETHSRHDHDIVAHAARRPLAIAAMALKHLQRLGGAFVANGSARASAGKGNFIAHS